MGKVLESVADKLKKTNDYLETHKKDFDKIVEGTRIAYDMATKLAQKNKKPVGSVFTGDPVADRALLQAEGISKVLQSKGIDVDVVLSLLYKVLELGVTFVSMGKK